MDRHSLYEILGLCTATYRKGAEVVTDRIGKVEVTHIYAMPEVKSAPTTEELVDVHFMKVGIRRDEAEREKANLVTLLNAWPDPDRLKAGPSYIEVGGVVGDQGAALCLFALGHYLKLWRVITPATMGITGPEADTLAGSGFVMVSGYFPEGVPDAKIP